MIKLAYNAFVSMVAIVMMFFVFGAVADLLLWVYNTGLLLYPMSIVPHIMYIYYTVYPNLPLIMLGAVGVYAFSYGLYKRYY